MNYGNKYPGIDKLQLGDTLVLPLCFQPGLHKEGTVVYIHPEKRFFTAEFDCGQNRIRESYCAHGKLGKVTDEFFMQLSHKYEVERMELKSRISALRRRLVELDSEQRGRDTFLAAVRKFMEMDRLTAPLLRELIERIDVYEIEGTGKNRTQRVVIHYRFVGFLELPDDVFRDSYKADTRQGVCVEYLRDPVTA